jgi:hypothetical protein
MESDPQNFIDLRMNNYEHKREKNGTLCGLVWAMVKTKLINLG